MTEPPATAADALAAIRPDADAARAAAMARYHKTDRAVLGVSNEVLNARATEWRRALAPTTRLDLADALWRDGTFEARILAAKLMTQARIRPDDAAAWTMLHGWVPDFDGWAIADAACAAIARRLTARPARLDDVEVWTSAEHLWTRRAALVATLPWAKQRDPTSAERASRERILAWAAGMTADPRWFVQKAVAWWLRDLSVRDPDRVRAFLDDHGQAMKPFARAEAARRMTPR